MIEIESPVKIKKTTQAEKDEFIEECIEFMNKHRKGEC